MMLTTPGFETHGHAGPGQKADVPGQHDAGTGAEVSSAGDLITHFEGSLRGFVPAGPRIELLKTPPTIKLMATDCQCRRVDATPVYNREQCG
jgi:hypothetical protein